MMPRALYRLMVSSSFIIAGIGLRVYAQQDAAKAPDTVRSLVTRANEERSLLIDAIKEGKQYAPQSQIGKMLLCAEAAEIGSAGWKEHLLNTLPTSDIQMEAFLEFTHLPENSELEPLFRIYYAKAFDAVAEHTNKLHAIFNIATQFGTKRWPDYDDSDWFCDELGRLRRRIPHQFRTALLTEKPSRRSYLAACGRHATGLAK
jgi:hypothetical protein